MDSAEAGLAGRTAGEIPASFDVLAATARLGAVEHAWRTFLAKLNERQQFEVERIVSGRLFRSGKESNPTGRISVQFRSRPLDAIFLGFGELKTNRIIRTERKVGGFESHLIHQNQEPQLKKSLLFSLSFFMPLPVFTLSI